MNNDLRIAELRETVEKVFARVNPPPETQIIEHECDECLALLKDLKGVEWWNLDGQIVERNYDNLPLLSPEAYRYYLPAFIKVALSDFDPDSEVLEFLIYSWSNYKDSQDPFFTLRKNALDQEHHKLIRSVLEMVEADDQFYSLHADARKGIRFFS